MNIVYLLDPKTQMGYPVEEFETSQEALDRKDNLKVLYKNHLFYHRINDLTPEKIYTIEEALKIINGN